MSYHSEFYGFDPDDDDVDTSACWGAACNRCGKGGLHWTDDGDGKYVLMETEYRIHKCDENILHKQTAGDFEALD